jgi:hypothetical protein
MDDVWLCLPVVYYAYIINSINIVALRVRRPLPYIADRDSNASAPGLQLFKFVVVTECLCCQRMKIVCFLRWKLKYTEGRTFVYSEKIISDVPLYSIKLTSGRRRNRLQYIVWRATEHVAVWLIVWVCEGS